MNFNLFSLALISLCTIVFSTRAQERSPKNNIELNGKIINGEDQNPLDYASISVFNLKDSSLISGGVTNEKGIFSIESEAVPFFIEVKFLGYLSKKLGPFSPADGQNKMPLGNIVLSEDAEKLAEVEVVAEKSQMQLQLDKRVFNVAKDLSNSGSNAAEILDNIPSVQVDVEGEVSLRGSSNVRILIDGKPSGMLGMNGADALRLLQGDMIDRVEVVTNPSSRYDAEGEVGIINIILKKEKKRGLNGAITAHLGYPHNYGLGVNLNYKKGKFNLFGSYSISYRKSPGFSKMRQEFTKDSLQITEQNSDRYRGGLNNVIRLGTDFYANDKNVFTVSGMFRPAKGINETNIEYLDFDSDGNIVQKTTRDDKETESKRSFQTSLNYTKTFEKKDQKFTVDLQWNKSNDIEKSNIVEAYSSANSEIQQRVENLEGGQDWLFQTDYVHPFSENGKFEVGAKSTFRTLDNDYKVEQLNSSAEWEIFGNYQDDLGYNENIYAAYAMAASKIKKFSIQGGVRTEYTDIDIRSNSEDIATRKRYFNWFPSTHLSYEINKNNTLQLSYSYRLSRPGYWSLLPFFSYSDSRNFYSGNPDLDPTFTHSTELGYLKYWETGSFFTSVYYRYRTGVVERILQLDADGNSVMFPINLSNEQASGLEVSLSQNIYKWWRVNLSGDIYWSERSGEYNNVLYEASTFRGNFRVNSQWKLPKDFSIQANFRYRSPFKNTQGRTLSMNTLDISVSKELIKKKATLTLSGKDLFNTRKRRSETIGENFERYSEFQWHSRQILLSFSYRINQNTKKGRQGGGGGAPGGDDMMDF